MSEKQSITSSLNTFGHEDLVGFASYLGMKYEDLIEIQKRNIEVQRKFLEKNNNIND
jgi:hypothetical protein